MDEDYGRIREDEPVDVNIKVGLASDNGDPICATRATLDPQLPPADLRRGKVDIADEE